MTVGTTNFPMTCTSDSIYRAISVNSSTGINQTIAKSSSIIISIGPITNPSAEVANPDSFSIIAYSSSTDRYATSSNCALEGVTSGLMV
jgi:hypothetical protein